MKTKTTTIKIGQGENVVIPLAFFAFTVCLVLFPAESLAGAGEGLQLWLNRVLPSLLPFAIGVNVLTQTGGIPVLSRALAPVTRFLFNLPGAGGAAMAAGLTSGYPMGAKAVADLRKQNLITPEEAQRLAGFSNNAGPLFIVGMAGTGLFNSAAAGYKLLAAHVLSAIALGIALGFTAPRKTSTAKIFTKQPAQPAQPFGEIFGGAVKNAMEAMALVGGLIVFFNVLTRVLGILGLSAGISAGLLEVTNGITNIAGSCLDYRLKLILAAGVVSFGGLSVHAQALSFLSPAGVKAAPYILCKIIHGLLAAVIMFFLTWPR